jgi:hypothetical protein
MQQQQLQYNCNYKHHRRIVTIRIYTEKKHETAATTATTCITADSYNQHLSRKEAYSNSNYSTTATKLHASRADSCNPPAPTRTFFAAFGLLFISQTVLLDFFQ